jgi:hypothetical protein
MMASHKTGNRVDINWRLRNLLTIPETSLGFSSLLLFLYTILFQVLHEKVYFDKESGW